MTGPARFLGRYEVAPEHRWTFMPAEDVVEPWYYLRLQVNSEQHAVLSVGTQIMAGTVSSEYQASVRTNTTELRVPYEEIRSLRIEALQGTWPKVIASIESQLLRDYPVVAHGLAYHGSLFGWAVGVDHSLVAGDYSTRVTFSRHVHQDEGNVTTHGLVHYKWSVGRHRTDGTETVVTSDHAVEGRRGHYFGLHQAYKDAQHWLTSSLSTRQLEMLTKEGFLQRIREYPNPEVELVPVGEYEVVTIQGDTYRLSPEPKHGIYVLTLDQIEVCYGFTPTDCLDRYLTLNPIRRPSIWERLA